MNCCRLCEDVLSCPSYGGYPELTSVTANAFQYYICRLSRSIKYGLKSKTNDEKKEEWTCSKRYITMNHNS